MRINGRRYSSLPVFFYKITHNLKHAHLRFQLTQNENCKEHLAPSQFLSRQLLKVLSVSASTTKSGKLFCGDAFPIEGVLVATYLLSVEALPHCRCGVANKNRIV